jgi:hypothetical protein
MLIEDLKEYVVVRVDERAGWSREIVGESALEGEAIRFAGELAELEVEGGVSYEVRASRGYALVCSTADDRALARNGDASWSR